MLSARFTITLPGVAARGRLCSTNGPARRVTTLSFVDVREWPNCIVAPDVTLPFRFFSVFVDTFCAGVVAAPVDSPMTGSTEGEYGGGFSRVRCPAEALGGSESASAALPVAILVDVFDGFVRCAEDVARKGETTSAVSESGRVTPCVWEEKTDETGEVSGDAMRETGPYRWGFAGFPLRIEGTGTVIGWGALKDGSPTDFACVLWRR